MKITYLGHAGFCVETKSSIIIMDPWLSMQGAFDASWFQYPKNHHMSGYVRSILSNSKKDKYIYISHEHQDHFDLEFLQSIKSIDCTIILANYTYPIVKIKLDEAHYNCKKIVLLNNEEKFFLKDGVIVLFIIDGELNCDSAILLKTHSQSFLNLNDCKVHDKLHYIVDKYGKVDVFTSQFSGASWYPTCYQMSQEMYQTACVTKITNKFEAMAEAIEVVKPRIYLSSSGPPCFLDPLLMSINFQEINAYPRASHLIAYLNQHYYALHESTEWPQIWPGSVLDVKTLKLTHQLNHSRRETDFENNITSYANEQKELFENRKQLNDKIEPAQVFLRLKNELTRKIKALKLVNDTVHTTLYWCISDYPEKMYCIDLAKKTIKVTKVIFDANNYCKITAPAWQVNKVLNKEISWPDFSLTFRFKLERVPEVYNTILHGFLILDAEKIASFCEKMHTTNSKNERIIVQCNGKKYSILRYCPHQGADLSEAHIEGQKIVCPRHQWQFDLSDQGKCKYNESTLQAICISDPP